jgi:hypothetical protein
MSCIMFPAKQDFHHERKWAAQEAWKMYSTFEEYDADHHLWNYHVGEREELKQTFDRSRADPVTTLAPK